jgi:thiol-disulfide isomerase/thioredoxin
MRINLAISTFLLLTVLNSCGEARSGESRRGSSMKKSAEVFDDHIGGEELDKVEQIKAFDYSPGKVSIFGEIQNAASVEGNYVRLFETEGRDYFMIDSASISNGKFQFNLDHVVPGIYKIGFESAENGLGELILNPSEPSVELALGSPNFRYGLMVRNSAENDLYKAYKEEERRAKNRIDQIRKSSSQNKRQEIYDEQGELKKLQTQYALRAPESFFANYVSHLQSPYRFEKSRYWNDINFKDISLIRTPIFPDRIEDYMRVHASKEKSDSDPYFGFYNAVDEIANMIKDEGDDRVLEFVLYTLSEGFFSSKMEDLSLYVIDNYFYGDACGDAEISELFKMRAAGIRNLQIGNSAPNILLSNPQGKSYELEKIASSADRTLVLFWASFCHKCERELPLIKSLYQRYKEKGFEIVAVSVDTDQNDWMKGIKEHRGGWIDLSDLQGWRGKAAKDYRVTSTPVMFLVDSDLKILSRPKTANELSDFLGKDEVIN